MTKDTEIWKYAQKIKKALVENDTQALSSMLEQWTALQGRLQAKYESLAAQLQASYTSSPGDVVALPRYRVVELEQTQLALADTIREVERLNEVWAGTIEARQLEMFDIAYSDSLDLLQIAAIDAGLDLSVLASLGGRLPAEAIQKLLDFVDTGTPLRELLAARFGEHLQGALDILVDGVAQGVNPRQVAREMVKALGPYADNALTIARTEAMRAYRAANTESYRLAPPGVVKGHKRVATRDTRTCLGCLMADGRFYALGKEIEEHPNGRCTSIPVLYGEEDPKWLHGKEWFLTLDPGVQREMLGPSRFEKWTNGQFSLDDLVTIRPNSTWGDSIGPTPLKDL